MFLFKFFISKNFYWKKWFKIQKCKGNVTRALKSGFNLIKRLIKSNVGNCVNQKVAIETTKEPSKLYKNEF